MTHEQLINRLYKLVEKFEREARASKDLARQTFDPDDPFCELRSADEPIWHQGCDAALSDAARDLEWLLGEFDPERRELNYHCISIRSYAKQYRCSLEESLHDYEGEGYFHAAPEMFKKVREALGIPAQNEDLHHY